MRCEVMRTCSAPLLHLAKLNRRVAGKDLAMEAVRLTHNIVRIVSSYVRLCVCAFEQCQFGDCLRLRAYVHVNGGACTHVP